MTEILQTFMYAVLGLTGACTVALLFATVRSWLI